MANIIRNPIVAQTIQAMSDRWHGIRCPLVGNVTMTKLPILLNLPSGIFPDTQYKLGFYLHKDTEFIFAINITFNKDKGRLF